MAASPAVVAARKVKVPDVPGESVSLAGVMVTPEGTPERVTVAGVLTPVAVIKS
jgi:hypothetical protein